MFDVLSMKKRGINWVKQLPIYAATINEDAKEELGWKTPFEIYYGRQSNRVKNPLTESAQTVRQEGKNPGYRLSFPT